MPCTKFQFVKMLKGSNNLKIVIILATIIGIYAQDITYYMVGDTLARTSLIY